MIIYVVYYDRVATIIKNALLKMIKNQVKIVIIDMNLETFYHELKRILI